MSDTLGGSVGAVRGAKRVVYIHFGQRSQLLGEFGIVLLFFRMEADILNQHHVAVF